MITPVFHNGVVLYLGTLQPPYQLSGQVADLDPAIPVDSHDHAAPAREIGRCRAAVGRVAHGLGLALNAAKAMRGAIGRVREVVEARRKEIGKPRNA